MVRRMLIVVAVAVLTYFPMSAGAESTSSTATLSVTILPSPLDAAMISDCQFTVVVGSDSALCTSTLLVADPTLELTGWRVILSAANITCACGPGNTLSADLLTIQSIAGPTFVNGQPIDHQHGPAISVNSLGMSLSTPQLVSEADAGYGNGAYSVGITFRLSVPPGTAEGTYVPLWSITLERQNTADATSDAFRMSRLAD